MRMPASTASAYFHPLESVLGTPAAVRVLRELTIAGGPVSQSEIARRTQLNLSGTGRVLNRLSGARVVVPIGQGRTLLYELNMQHPLVNELISLFQAEEKRVNAVYKIIRQAARALSPRPDAIWLFGSVARKKDNTRSDMDIMLIADGRRVKPQADELREKLAILESQYDVYPSIVTLSRTEIREMVVKQSPLWNSLVNEAISLFGPSPKEYLNG